MHGRLFRAGASTPADLKREADRERLVQPFQRQVKPSNREKTGRRKIEAAKQDLHIHNTNPLPSLPVPRLTQTKGPRPSPEFGYMPGCGKGRSIAATLQPRSTALG
jgi:hypothetical protein